MRVTVAICTWNRARSLDRTLKAFAGLRIPAGVTWELLVVNNNSTDDTDQVIAAHAAALPVRGLTEKRPGKSYAANAAIAAATGELILWTDDDVLVDPEFLAAYVTAANERPDAAFFGGTVEPLFEGSTPPWIERHVEFLSEVYALARYGAATE